MRFQELRQSDAEMLVLAVLAERPAYGYAISKAVGGQSEGALRLTPGALYPLLARLEAGGLIQSEWEEVKSGRSGPDSPGRRRKWYRLSPKGRRRLDKHVASHRAYVALMESFIRGHREGAE
jgi:PadR family transcriptional regulator, regulatory protein PadR